MAIKHMSEKARKEKARKAADTRAVAKAVADGRVILNDWNADEGPNDAQVVAAARILRAEYWTSIRAMAKTIADDIRAGELNRGDVYDRIHEDVDGCYWVIYTAANYRALLASDHCPFDVAEEEGFDMPENPAQCAYYVVGVDVREQVDAELGDEEDD